MSRGPELAVGAGARPVLLVALDEPVEMAQLTRAGLFVIDKSPPRRFESVKEPVPRDALKRSFDAVLREVNTKAGDASTRSPEGRGPAPPPLRPPPNLFMVHSISRLVRHDRTPVHRSLERFVVRCLPRYEFIRCGCH